YCLRDEPRNIRSRISGACSSPKRIAELQREPMSEREPVTESGTTAMRGHDRCLQFDTIRQGEQITARCSLCKREFMETPKADERTDKAILRLRAQFKAHKCDSTSST